MSLTYFRLVLPNPPRCWPMAILEVKSYLDNSGDEKDSQHKICSIAGYVITIKKWRHYDKLWKKILKKYKVPYLHMKEFAHYKPPFDIFWDEKLKKEKPDRKHFLQALINVMQDSRLQGVVSVVNLDDLEKFNHNNNCKIDALALNLFTCMIFIGSLFPQTAKTKIVEVVIDKLEKANSIIEKAKEYAKTDLVFANRCKHIDLRPLNENLTFKDMTPIQAADFLSWEARKDMTIKEDRKAKYKDIEDIKRICNYDHNRFLYPRQSFENLMKSIPPEGMLWDYEWLERMDNARKHVWP